MKVKYRATSKRTFRMQFIWLIGFGFAKGYYPVDKYNLVESVVIYLPFCRIDITQYFVEAC